MVKDWKENWVSLPRTLPIKGFVPKHGATIGEITKFGTIDVYAEIHSFYVNGQYFGFANINTGIRLRIKKVKKAGGLHYGEF